MFMNKFSNLLSVLEQPAPVLSRRMIRFATPSDSARVSGLSPAVPEERFAQRRALGAGGVLIASAGQFTGAEFSALSTAHLLDQVGT